MMAHQVPPQPPLPAQPQRPPQNPDLTRRSIKERLIQLLALKPFKKPELYLRLNSEGIKEKERSLVNKILPQIGSLKDNCYHLRRHMWNDVNEDWPFYTEEEKRMLKSTRVIKPNQTDIDRRVKVRSSHHLYSSGPAALGAERPERPDRPERALGPLGPDRPERPDRPDRTERVERAAPPRAPPAAHPHQVPPQPPLPTQPQRPPQNPDLTRRSIKERLIQLLALKPFKKAELYLRLNSEGIKEKERSLVNKILPQIGSLKDNCYHLRRHMWNDVNKDWPFYTEEEKRMLKRSVSPKRLL